MTINYKFVKDIFTNQNCGVLRTKDGVTSQIPLDEANTDYQEYLKWAKTNTTEAADQMKAKTIVLSSLLVFSGCIFLGVTNLQVTESNKNLSRDLDDFVRMFKMPVYNIN